MENGISHNETSQQYHVKVAETIDEACKLIEQSFE